MKIDVLLGLQWGDEGKGKIVDVLTRNYNVIARFQGGPNAGHTLEIGNMKHVLHTIPSGIFHEGTSNVIGNGVVIDPVILMKEIDNLKQYDLDLKKKLSISRRAHLILPSHRVLDAASEEAKGKMKIGSTLKGIGPTYMDKTGRNGLRVGDIELSDFRERYQALVEKHKTILKQYDHEYNLDELEPAWFEAIERLKEFTLIDSEHYINDALNSGKRILAEGAQGAMLDVDFGTYPYVTSSSTISAGASNGLGVAPNKIKDVFGIFKAYCTRVGSGPFPTELEDEVGQKLRDLGNEYGATTGRPRRCGWIDLPALKYAIMVNGVTKLIMMKADVLSSFETIKVCTHYKYRGELVDYLPYNIEPQNVEAVYKELPGWSEDLTATTEWSDMPDTLCAYVDYLEKELKVPIEIVSVGPKRSQTLMREELKAALS